MTGVRVANGKFDMMESASVMVEAEKTRFGAGVYEPHVRSRKYII